MPNGGGSASLGVYMKADKPPRYGPSGRQYVPYLLSFFCPHHPHNQFHRCPLHNHLFRLSNPPSHPIPCPPHIRCQSSSLHSHPHHQFPCPDHRKILQGIHLLSTEDRSMRNTT